MTKETRLPTLPVSRRDAALVLNKLISTQAGRDALDESGYRSGRPLFVCGHDESVADSVQRIFDYSEILKPVAMFTSRSDNPDGGWALIPLEEDDVLELHDAIENEPGSSVLVMSHFL